MRLIRVGDSSLLVEVGDTATATAVYAEARRRDVRCVDIVPAARTVLFDGLEDPEATASLLEAWDLTPGPGAAAASEGLSAGPAEPHRVEVPTTYDGADLDTVARLWQMTTEEVVQTHAATEFVVAFCGFSPGFAYCTGLPPDLAVPRRDSPRSKVPAGSVGLAGEFTGVYPTGSPGGWQLIGRTELTLWDSSAEQPATLTPGTRVRFVVT